MGIETAPLIPFKKLALEGLTTRSAPMPFVRSFWLSVEHAHEDGHNRQDHDHLNGHSEHADDGADWTMKQVGEDELIHSRLWLRGAKNSLRASLSG